MWLPEFPSLVSGEKDKRHLQRKSPSCKSSANSVQCLSLGRKKSSNTGIQELCQAESLELLKRHSSCICCMKWSLVSFYSENKCSSATFLFCCDLIACFFSKGNKAFGKTKLPHLILKQTRRFLLLLHRRNYAFSMAKTQQNCRLKNTNYLISVAPCWKLLHDESQSDLELL